MVARPNPIIGGWSASYRSVVSKRTLVQLDTHRWKLARSWAKRRHPNKPGRWVVDRYSGAFHPTRRDRWVFGDRSSGAHLARSAWTDIVRHQQVKGWASPGDPALADDWAERRRRRKPPAGPVPAAPVAGQHGRCRLCRGLLLPADHEPQTPHEWQQWVTATRTAIRKQAVITKAGRGTPDEPVAPQLLHAHRARRHHSGGANGSAS